MKQVHVGMFMHSGWQGEKMTQLLSSEGSRFIEIPFSRVTRASHSLFFRSLCFTSDNDSSTIDGGRHCWLCPDPLASLMVSGAHPQLLRALLLMAAATCF